MPFSLWHSRWPGSGAALTARPPCCMITMMNPRESGGCDMSPCLAQRTNTYLSIPVCWSCGAEGGCPLSLGPLVTEP